MTPPAPTEPQITTIGEKPWWWPRPLPDIRDKNLVYGVLSPNTKSKSKRKRENDPSLYGRPGGEHKTDENRREEEARRHFSLPVPEGGVGHVEVYPSARCAALSAAASDRARALSKAYDTSHHLAASAALAKRHAETEADAVANLESGYPPEYLAARFEVVPMREEPRQATPPPD